MTYVSRENHTTPSQVNQGIDWLSRRGVNVGCIDRSSWARRLRDYDVRVVRRFFELLATLQTLPVSNEIDILCQSIRRELFEKGERQDGKVA